MTNKLFFIPWCRNLRFKKLIKNIVGADASVRPHREIKLIYIFTIIRYKLKK